VPQIVTFSEEEKYSLIQLDDGKANALGFAMLEQIDEALNQAEAAGKVLVIAGRPGKFSAGFDLAVMGEGGDALVSILRAGATLAQRLLGFPTPVVLAVSGHALAMGGLLLLTADYRIGTAGNFKIGLNEVAIGMTMPWFGVELGRARLVPAHFERAVSCASLYDADGAVEAGFLDEAVDVDQLMSRAVVVAEQLSDLDLAAHKATKDRVREPLNRALEQAIAQELPA
jgi:enoyl-CoA hydratase